jgi:hypothetical protein
VIIDASLLQARGVDIVVNVISGSLVVAIAFGAWYVKERLSARRARALTLQQRASRLKLLQAELETIVSFTSQCTMSVNALEQFAAFQQWLVANGLLSWKQNRLVVHTWQKTSGSVSGIRQGQVPVARDLVEELVADMKKIEFPAPEDDHFRWNASETPKPVEPTIE